MVFICLVCKWRIRVQPRIMVSSNRFLKCHPWLPTIQRQVIVCISHLNTVAAHSSLYVTHRHHRWHTVGQKMPKIKFMEDSLLNESLLVPHSLASSQSHDGDHKMCHTCEHHGTWAFRGKAICCPNKLTLKKTRAYNHSNWREHLFGHWRMK